MERQDIFMTVFTELTGKTSILTIILLSLFVSVSFPAQLYGWELAKEDEKNEIKIFTREVENSNFKEYKAVMKIKASLSSLVALVDDIAACPKWIHTCSQGKLLERISPTESYNYTINEAPWPVSDRDAIVHTTISQPTPKGPVTIDIRGVPGYIPQKKGLIRVKMIKGFWRFTPLGKGFAEVIYQVHNDPGGDLPSWLVNSVVISQPYHTMINMREMVNKTKYRDARFDFIVE